MARILVATLLAAAAAQANQYKILVTRATCAPAKRVGNEAQPWDFGDGKPDPYVVVAINGEPVYVSGVNQDTLHARWFTGTEYWSLPMTARVTITVRDADAAKMVAGVGMVGVAVRPDIPKIGKRIINGALAHVDTDDTIAVWSGTLGQLRAACGAGTADLFRPAAGPQRFTGNAGLRSLRVRLIERPPGFDVTTPREKRYLGVAGATIEPVKRAGRKPWDIGPGGTARPDPRYVVYVNGSPVVAGGVNKDSFTATWAGDPPALDLRDDDTIAVALFDADAASQLSSVGKAAVLFSPSLPAASKERVYETLNKMATDDLIFLWVGSWKTLAKAPALPRTAKDPHTWWNDGLQRATPRFRPAKRAAGPALRMVVVSAVIAPRKSNGKAWDMGKGAPDPLVRCLVPAAAGGWKTVGESVPLKDNLQPVWRLAVKDGLRAGTRVKFEVYDKDGVSNDVVGTVVVSLPAKPGTYEASGGAITRLVYQVR